jgi:hypothetical protein
MSSKETETSIKIQPEVATENETSNPQFTSRKLSTAISTIPEVTSTDPLRRSRIKYITAIINASVADMRKLQQNRSPNE